MSGANSNKGTGKLRQVKLRLLLPLMLTIASPAWPQGTEVALPPVTDSKGTVVEAPFMETFPGLKTYLYKEPPSNYFLGLGLSPVGVLKDRTVFTGDFFQLHYRGELWDLLLFNASYGVTRAQVATYQSNNFTFSTAAKMRVGRILSLGLLAGYEFVNFPNLNATLVKVPYQTPLESFSSRGMIYGVIASQTFNYRSYLLQINELGYQQTYSNINTAEGWTYYYDNKAVRANPALVGPGFVAMIKVSLLF